MVPRTPEVVLASWGQRNGTTKREPLLEGCREPRRVDFSEMKRYGPKREVQQMRELGALVRAL